MQAGWFGMETLRKEKNREKQENMKGSGALS
jgi:hypothetical protein